jgi:hypothetical protein
MRRRHDRIDVSRKTDPGARSDTPSGVASDRAVDDPPEAFRWRGRRYVVTEVLGHWVEVGAWWRRTESAVLPAPAASRQQWWWRVAARPTHPAAQGRNGVYELCCSAGDWSLRRVHD